MRLRLPQDHTIAGNPTTPSAPHKHRRTQPSPLPTYAPCLDWAHPAHDCARNRFAPAVSRRPRQAAPSARVLGTQPSGRSHLGRAPPQASVRPCPRHAAKWAIPLGTSTGSFRPPAAPMAHFDQMSATVYPSGNGSEGSQTTSQYLRVPTQMWLGRAQSRRRRGWGEPSPDAVVAGASPSGIGSEASQISLQAKRSRSDYQ